MCFENSIQVVKHKVELIKSKLAHNDAVSELQTQLNNQYLNGGVILERFEIENFEQINHSPIGWNKVIWELVKHQSIYRQLVHHKLEVEFQEMPADFEAVSSFEILSHLAGILNHGGAYSKLNHRMTDQQSVQLAWNAIKVLFPDELSSYHLFKTHAPWSNWHFGVAWDYSFFMFGKGYTEMTMMLLTDTD